MHAAYLIQMLDTALNMLGPDTDLLNDILAELGQKHVRYGVRPEMFPVMGVCLIDTLEEVLKDTVMTPSVKEAWSVTYKSLSDEMIKAQKSK